MTGCVHSLEVFAGSASVFFFPSVPASCGRRHTHSTLDQHSLNGRFWVRHDCGSVCGLCRQADRALTSLSKHFYLFISAFGLRRFCGANLHNSLVLRGAWTPWYRYDEGAAHEGTQWLLRSLLKYHTGPWLSRIEFSHWSTSCHAE